MVSIPTWSNRHIGPESICKRLDRLLLLANFLDNDFLFKQWNVCGGDSDHQPIYLQILSSIPKARCPFNFNSC